MIVTDEYAIGHIGKTGGDALVDMFLHAGIKFTMPTKHMSFISVHVERPIYALTFRRLPHRELSHMHQQMLTEGGAYRGPEYWIQRRSGECELVAMIKGVTVTEWIRCENLAKEAEQFILRHHGRHVDLESVPTKDRNNYDHDIWSFWNKDQVRRLYEASPTWAKTERHLYGGLVV